MTSIQFAEKEINVDVYKTDRNFLFQYRTYNTMYPFDNKRCRAQYLYI